MTLPSGCSSGTTPVNQGASVKAVSAETVNLTGQFCDIGGKNLPLFIICWPYCAERRLSYGGIVVII